MENKTMLYGLLALAGILVYYAWEKNSLSGKQNIASTTSGTFVDDVPVNPKVLEIKSEDVKADGIKGFALQIKDSVSQITEPFIEMAK